MKLVSLVGLFSTAGASHTYDLTIDMCDSSGCHPSQKRVALDAAAKPGHENQVHASGDSLTLEYAQWIGGPRVYLIEQDGVNENTMFQLAGKEFTFDVELSRMGCGFNAAAYLIGMTSNSGGAEAGTKYCDAQAVGGTYCSEMDLFEGNTAAQQVTTHGCIDQCASYSDASGCKHGQAADEKNVCDHSGCGMNPFRYGPGSGYSDSTFNEGWYGSGSQYQLDSSQPYTVTTQFHTDHMERFYIQNGMRVDLPTLYVKTPSDGAHYDPFYNPKINDEYCGDTYDKWTGDGGVGPASGMMKNAGNGMVLSMSVWYDEEVGPDRGMSWLDGYNGWGQVGPCNSYPTSDQGSHGATFSKIRFGDIGTTVAPAPPAPTPPPPPPPPPAPQCCQGGCNGYCQGGWCGQSASNCGQCSGQFCPGVLV